MIDLDRRNANMHLKFSNRPSKSFFYSLGDFLDVKVVFMILQLAITTVL
jgi:hypothetical protein